MSLDHWFTQRPHSSSFLGLPYKILYMHPKKELLWGLRVGYRCLGCRDLFRHPVLQTLEFCGFR